MRKNPFTWPVLMLAPATAPGGIKLKALRCPRSPGRSTSNDLGATGFASDITPLNGRRFLRFEIRFDIATDPKNRPTPLTPRREVRRLQSPFKD